MRRTALLALSLLCGAAAAESPAHWSYAGTHGPERWAQIDDAFAACAGRNQSPVDLGQPIDAVLPPLDLEFSAGPQQVIDNGHTVQVDAAGGSRLQLDRLRFTLRQFHFHAPSEHRIDGVEFPLELHLVHADDDGRLAVLGVLFRVGAAHPRLDALLAARPSSTARPLPAPLEVASLLPEQRAYYRYNGSLTTPPCTEGVRWLVLQQPIEASAGQIDALARAMRHANNRPLQPLNARVVLE